MLHLASFGAGFLCLIAACFVLAPGLLMARRADVTELARIRVPLVTAHL